MITARNSTTAAAADAPNDGWCSTDDWHDADGWPTTTANPQPDATHATR